MTAPLAVRYITFLSCIVTLIYPDKLILHYIRYLGTSNNFTPGSSQQAANKMSKPTLKQAYQDDPDSVSMHTTPDDYEYAEPSSEGLPSYSDSEAAASSSVTVQEDVAQTTRTPLIEPYDVIEYPSGPKGANLPGYSKPTSKSAVTIRMDERLNDPYQLHRYIVDYMSGMAPRPIVRIEGWHTETVRRKDKKEKERVADFDVSFSLQQYLSKAYDAEFWAERIVEDGDSAHRGGWRKTKAPGYKPGVQLTDEPERTLQDWCEDYCASTSKLKVFRINRPVHGINEELLRSHIESVVRSTHYRGTTNITFRVDEKAVDIYWPTLVNRWRTGWVRWIFYLTFLWIVTWPILFFTTKWWDVYSVDWYFSCSDGVTGRKYASISELQWLEQHRALIRELVLNKYKGDGDCHPTEFAPNQASSTPQTQMPKITGNANINSAVGIIQGGVNVWNAVAAGRSTAEQGWGYDC